MIRRDAHVFCPVSHRDYFFLSRCMDVSLGDKPGKIEHESMLIPEPAKLREEPGQVPSDSRVEVVGDPSSLVVSSDSPTVLRAAGAGSSGRPAGGLPSQFSQYPLPGPGDVIDSFVLEAAIGEGGMGAVYRRSGYEARAACRVEVASPRSGE